MQVFNSYIAVILFSLIIILSYLFNLIAKKTNIPSVLLLISLGIIIKQVMKFMGIPQYELFSLLEILGIVGLIMIVLEAALELELTKEKWPIIWKSFSVALLGLGGSALVCAMVINFFIVQDTFIALVYAIPLSVLSSAIIIPSVGGLADKKKEFMIYESTFSDILGIMFFYFLIGNAEASNAKVVVLDIVGNIFLTITLSMLISYTLVLIFQKLKTKVKLFLIIAILLLLYSIAKLFHLSSLLIILTFGLVLNNHKVFFRGFLKKWIREDAIKGILHDFHLITLESAFVVRTFFFVIFGVSITLSSLISIEVALISATIILGLYFVRFLMLKIFLWKNILPELYIAPRGLITILLFFAIPEAYQVKEFNSGILLYTILATSVIMSFSLMSYKKQEEIVLGPEEAEPAKPSDIVPESEVEPF